MRQARRRGGGGKQPALRWSLLWALHAHGVQISWLHCCLKCDASQTAKNWRPLAVHAGFGGLRVRGGTAPIFQRVAVPRGAQLRLLEKLDDLRPRLQAPLGPVSVEEAGDKEHSTPSRPELLVLARALQPPSVKGTAQSPRERGSHPIMFSLPQPSQP